MSGSPSLVKAAPTARGVCIRVEGQGTMRESYAARELIEQTLHGSDSAQVVVDLTQCPYLDSTFLGLLMGAARGHRDRFIVAGSPEQRHKLLGPLNLDRFIASVEAPPPVTGEWVTLQTRVELSDREMSRHIMECHRRLAELGGPTQTIFLKIAEQMAKELGEG